MELIHPAPKLCYPIKNYKLLYLYINKNASSSMRTLFNMENGNRRQNFSQVQEQNPDYRSLIILRNPYTRITSSYNEICKCRRDAKPVFKELKKNPPAWELTSKSEFYKNFRKNEFEKSFDLFLNFIDEHGFYEPHLIPQSLFLTEKNLTLNDVDFVYLLDKGRNPIKEICNDFQIKKQSPQTNKTKYNKIKSIELTDNQKKIVDKLYPEDVEMYKEIISSHKAN